MIKFLEVLLFALPSLAVERSDIPDKYKWDTTQLYATDAAWAKKRDEIAGRIPKLGAYQGHLGESAVKFYEALSSLLQVDEDLSQLSTYANMRTDEDTRAGAALSSPGPRSSCLPAGRSASTHKATPDTAPSPTARTATASSRPSSRVSSSSSARSAPRWTRT